MLRLAKGHIKFSLEFVSNYGITLPVDPGRRVALVNFCAPTRHPPNVSKTAQPCNQILIDYWLIN